jgi:hypothetical protein
LDTHAPQPIKFILFWYSTHHKEGEGRGVKGAGA